MEPEVITSDHINSNFSTRCQNQKVFTVLIGLTILFFTLLAWNRRFVQDDAFISFQYARNLAEGYGLTWNQSEYVEGYTNFLWVCLLVPVFWFEADPIWFTSFFGVLCFFGSLLFMVRLGQFLFSSPLLTWLGVLFLGSHSSFSYYATGGLETSLQNFLCLWLLFQTISFRGDLRHCLLFSCTATLCMLNRLDSLILLALCFPYCFSLLYAQKKLKRPLFVLCFPFLLFLSLWFGWKFWYYGNILPNTFYIKFNVSLERGFFYLYLFFLSYGLFPFLFWLICTVPQMKKAPKEQKLLFTFFFFGCAYLLYVGGGFMEFRLLMPYLPAFFLLILGLFQKSHLPHSLFTALSLLILFGSLHHLYFFETLLDRKGIDTISQLDSYVNEQNLNWTHIGKALYSYFPEQDILLAASPVGAIPYYSRLKTLDILGLNDAWVAHHGEKRGDRPGHQTYATWDYLKKRQVHLLLGNPWIKPRQRQVSYTLKNLNQFTDVVLPSLSELPPTARVLEIPITSEHVLVGVYIFPHPAIEEAIQRLQWGQYRILP